MVLFWEAWGIIAGLITSSGYVPQILKGFKTRKLEDLSYLLNALMGLGMLMWLLYGIRINSIAVISANIIGVSLNVTLILMKYYFHKSKAKSIS